jgi:hypothetical protein
MLNEPAGIRRSFAGEPAVPRGDRLCRPCSPAREAIWWGCMCLQHACGDSLSLTEKAACRAAVQWVLQPTEENRAAAKAPADKAGPTNPAGALAAAAKPNRGQPASGQRAEHAPRVVCAAQSSRHGGQTCL